MFKLKMLFNLKNGYHVTADDITVTFW